MFFDDDSWKDYDNFVLEEIPKFEVNQKVYFMGRIHEPGLVKDKRVDSRGDPEYLIEYSNGWQNVGTWQNGRNWKDKYDCTHSWKQYVGVTHVFDFCEICQEKKNHKP